MAVNATRGIALSGLEFGSGVPGALNTDFFDSSANTYAYFKGKGFATARLPFLWERLQPDLGGDLDPTYKSYIDDQISKAATVGLKIILDCHNYGRRQVYSDGGITENFTESATSLVYPYADYSQSGNIVLRNYGEAVLGTANNPLSPATGYNISFNMKFNNRDDSFGGEGLYIRPMWTDDNNCYEFGANLADGTWILSKTVSGAKTILLSGTKNWGTTSTYAISIDVNQATNGKINITVNGSALFTTNSVSSDNALTKGKIAFFPQGVHVQLDTMVLNINGDTSSGGKVVYVIGDTNNKVLISDFANLWSKLAAAYNGNSTVYAYDIINEPHDMPVPTTPSNYNTTATVTLLMQACINAIRAIDTTHFIIAENDHWAGGQNFSTDYGATPTPWLTDSTGFLVYSFHYYFDDDHSGSYQQAFATDNNDDVSEDVTPIMQWAQNNKVFLHCGEYGVPNTSDWQVCLTTFLNLCDTYLVWANHWAAGDSYSSITTLQPTGTSPNYTDQLQMAIVSQHVGQFFQYPPTTSTSSSSSTSTSTTTTSTSTSTTSSSTSTTSTSTSATHTSTSSSTSITSSSTTNTSSSTTNTSTSQTSTSTTTTVISPYNFVVDQIDQQLMM